MSLILGIDPGSRITGYGLVLFERGQPKHVDNGTINADADNFPDRIGQIHAGLAEVISHYRPQEVAIEEVFVNKNVSSALKLGQARGAAIVAATSVNGDRSMRTERAAGPSPMMRSSSKSSMAG